MESNMNVITGNQGTAAVGAARQTDSKAVRTPGYSNAPAGTAKTANSLPV
jgi:hypothetical protein